MRMHKLLAAAALSTCLLSGGAWAQSADERLEALEQRIQQLEERLAERDAAMMEKEQALAKLQAKVAVQEQTAADIRAKAEEAAGDGGLGIGGAVEVEIVHDSPYEGESTSSNDTATVDVAFAAEISDAVSAEIALTMGDEGVIEVDEAFFVVGMEDMPVSLQAGQFALPFASFDTGLVSDPLALELGEAGESALLLSFESGGLSASAYVFNGGVDYSDRDRIGDVGVQVDYGIEMGGIDVSLGFGWINDVAEGDTLEDAEAASGKRVEGLAVSGGLGFGPVSFAGHYMNARDELGGLDWNDGSGQPAAYGVEAGYALEMGGREVAFAAGWQRTREALGLEMPESRVLFGVSTELVEGIGAALEYARHNDYGTDSCAGEDDDGNEVCGTGRSGSTVTLVLAAEF